MHRGAGVIVAAVLLAGLAGPASAAAAPVADAQAEARLEQVIAALEGEAARLGELTAGPRLGGADWSAAVRADLLATEVRVWGWRAAAAGALADLLGGAVSARVRGAASPASLIPALGLIAEDSAEVAALRPVLNDWATYRRSLSRVLALMDRLRAAVAAAGTAGLLPPGRVCPVDGPNTFRPTWGEERPWGRTHKGEDVHAAWGTPLVAIESGTILQSGWNWAGGFGVYLEGYYSGDVYYYAHLAGSAPGIQPGAVVEVGDLLGWVGATGNAESPHLHLGWIPDNLGRWVDLEGLADPYPLLLGLCGGL